MSNARDIIIAPLITEKTMKISETDNKYTFEVAVGANKTQIKQAIEEIFSVKVEKVNVVNVKPKTKKMGRYVGTTNRRRKAYVKLAEGHEIKLF